MNEWWLKDYGDLDEIEQRIINWIKSHPNIFMPRIILKLWIGLIQEKTQLYFQHSNPPLN